VGKIASDRITARTLAKSTKLTLRKGSENDDTIGNTGCDCGSCVAHSGCTATATTAPLHIGKPQFRTTQGCCKTRRIASIVTEGCKTIEFLRRYSRIFASGFNSFQRKFEFSVWRFSPLVIGCFADAGNGNFAP
jgi:hypothetical protein